MNKQHVTCSYYILLVMNFHMTERERGEDRNKERLRGTGKDGTDRERKGRTMGGGKMERKIFLYLPKKAKASEIVEKLTKESKLFTEFYCVVRRTTINACLHHVLIPPSIDFTSKLVFLFFLLRNKSACISFCPSVFQSVRVKVRQSL